MTRRTRARLCSPLIALAFVCLVVYERLVEGEFYEASIQ